MVANSITVLCKHSRSSPHGATIRCRTASRASVSHGRNLHRAGGQVEEARAIRERSHGGDGPVLKGLTTTNMNTIPSYHPAASCNHRDERDDTRHTTSCTSPSAFQGKESLYHHPSHRPGGLQSILPTPSCRLLILRSISSGVLGARSAFCCSFAERVFGF
jgi:hypothetical protein